MERCVGVELCWPRKLQDRQCSAGLAWCIGCSLQFGRVVSVRGFGSNLSLLTSSFSISLIFSFVSFFFYHISRSTLKRYGRQIEMNIINNTNMDQLQKLQTKNYIYSDSFIAPPPAVFCPVAFAGHCSLEKKKMKSTTQGLGDCSRQNPAQLSL